MFKKVAFLQTTRPYLPGTSILEAPNKIVHANQSPEEL